MDLDIFYELTGGGLPNGELRKRMFDYHNALVSSKIIVGKQENPNTSCGCCVQRVKSNLWKYYHQLPDEKKLSTLDFTGKFVVHNMPRYVRKEITQG